MHKNPQATVTITLTGAAGSGKDFLFAQIAPVLATFGLSVERSGEHGWTVSHPAGVPAALVAPHRRPKAPNREPDLVLALDRIADAARQEASENPLQVILELAEDALAGREVSEADRLAAAVDALVDFAHARSSAAGWWIDPLTGKDLSSFDWFPYVVGTKLMLVVSEIAEGMEGHRKGLNDTHLPHRPMIEVEFADALLRIGDLAGKLRLSLGAAVVEKASYNAVRPDHQPGARMVAGGKAY